LGDKLNTVKCTVR